MGFFTTVGMLTCIVVAIAVGLIVWHILANIYFGIRGALRMRNLVGAKTNNLQAVRWVIRAGFRNWLGQPTTYWTYNGREVPVDGRYPIEDHRP